jgi:hypothetical protein
MLDADMERGHSPGISVNKEEQQGGTDQGEQEEQQKQEGGPVPFVTQYDLTFAPEGEREVRGW